MNKRIVLEELNKMKYLFDYKRGVVVSEQRSLDPRFDGEIGKVYSRFFHGALGPGTYKNRFIDGFKLLKNLDQFNQLNDHMKKYPIEGKTSVIELLRDELDSTVPDENDYKIMRQIALSKGINLNYPVVKIKDRGEQFNPGNIELDTTKSQEVVAPIVQSNEWPATERGGGNSNVTVGYSPSQSTSTDTPGGKTIATKKPKMVFKPNDEFPLLYGQKGQKIKDLQTKLGIKPNLGNFGSKTEGVVKNKMTELGLGYNRKTGISNIEVYNQLLGSIKQAPEVRASREDVQSAISPEIKTSAKLPTGNITPNPNLPQATDIQRAQSTADQAAANLQQAKDDRVQARKTVRDTRREKRQANRNLRRLNRQERRANAAGQTTTDINEL